MENRKIEVGQIWQLISDMLVDFDPTGKGKIIGGRPILLKKGEFI